MQGSLARLPIGIPAIVIQVGCRKELAGRLRDFGLVPGTKVISNYRSPGGGVTAVEFRGVVIALRTLDLKGVRVQWQ